MRWITHYNPSCDRLVILARSKDQATWIGSSDRSQFHTVAPD